MSPELAVAQAALSFRSRQLAKSVGELGQRVAADDQLPFALVFELVAATPPQPDVSATRSSRSPRASTVSSANSDCHRLEPVQSGAAISSKNPTMSVT